MNCFECKHRGKAGSNTIHSKCTHPVVDLIMSDHDALRILMDGLINKDKVPYIGWDLKLEVHEGAVANSWCSWPWNFDPRWINSCTGFEEE